MLLHHAPAPQPQADANMVRIGVGMSRMPASRRRSSGTVVAQLPTSAGVPVVAPPWCRIPPRASPKQMRCIRLLWGNP